MTEGTHIMRRITAIALLPVVAITLSACGGAGDTVAGTEPAATLSIATEGATTTDDSTAGSGGTADDDSSASVQMGEEVFSTGVGVGGPYGELRDGAWGVGVAGEVDFRVTGPDTLELVNIVVNDGWQVREQEVESDKIDIEFQRGTVEYTFEVEIDGGLLELEIDQDIDPADPGTFAVGEAGTVAVTVENGRVVLGENSIGDGWNEVKREVDDDDIELDYRRDGSGFFEQWEIRVDREDRGLDVEVDYEIEGRFTG